MRQLRHGARAGAVTALVTAFLVLVGFTGVAAGIATHALPAPAAEANASVRAMALVLLLLGAWTGWRAARWHGRERRHAAVVAGLVAATVAGLGVGALSALLAAVAAGGGDPRGYLAQLSPEAIRQLALGRSGIAALATHVGLFAAGGLAGAVVAELLAATPWRARASGSVHAAVRATAAGAALRAVSAHARVRSALKLAVLGGAILLPQVLDNYWNFTLGTVGIYVLMALGLNIVVGLAGLLDLGYVAFFAVGAYTVGLLTAPAPHDLRWSFWLALPVGVALAGLAGVVLGVPVLRLRGDYLAIVTLGFGEIIRILIKSDALKALTGGPKGVTYIAGPTLAGSPFSERGYLYLILVAILLVILVTRRLERSRVGRAWMAMREDETVARAQGIDVYRAKLLAFAIGAAFAGLGGVLFAARNQFTGPEDHNLMVSINVLCTVIVGGMGSVPGVILGAFVLKGLPELLRQVDEYRMLAFGALLVAMMIWRPQGLWPPRRRRLEPVPSRGDAGDAEAIADARPPARASGAVAP